MRLLKILILLLSPCWVFAQADKATQLERYSTPPTHIPGPTEPGTVVVRDTMIYGHVGNGVWKNIFQSAGGGGGGTVTGNLQQVTDQGNTTASRLFTAGYETTGTAKTVIAGGNYVVTSPVSYIDNNTEGGTFLWRTMLNSTMTEVGTFSASGSRILSPLGVGRSPRAGIMLDVAGVIESTSNIQTTKRFVGGFGAENVTGSNDWNDLSNLMAGSGPTLALSAGANGPTTVAGRHHIFNFDYATKNDGADVTQMAFPYRSGNGLTQGLFYRGVINTSTFSPWYQIPAVATTSLTNGDLLTYNSSNQSWERLERSSIQGAGPQGEQGIQGEQGPAGADGADGQDGADGLNGAQGEPGAAGPPWDQVADGDIIMGANRIRNSTGSSGQLVVGPTTVAIGTESGFWSFNDEVSMPINTTLPVGASGQFYWRTLNENGYFRSRPFMFLDEDRLTTSSVATQTQARIMTDQDFALPVRRVLPSETTFASGSIEARFNVAGLKPGTYNVIYYFRVKSNTVGGGISWEANPNSIDAANSHYTDKGLVEIERDWTSLRSDNVPGSVPDLYAVFRYEGQMVFTASGIVTHSLGPNGTGNMTLGENSFVEYMRVSD